MGSHSTTPLGALGRGLLAGAAGTAAMTAWQGLSARLRSGGEGDGDGAAENDSPADPWEQAPAPARVARRIGEGVFRREVGPELIGPLTHVMHWAYGTGWGAAYGLVAGSRDSDALRDGLAFGLAVWAASYAQLVPMGLYEPPWTYPPGELAMDASYHLVYGAGTGLAYAALA